MIRLIVMGAWGCAIALMSCYSAIYMKAHQGKVVGSDETFVGVEYRKTRPLNIPVIDAGEVQGYIVAQFVFTANSTEMKRAPVPLELYVLDEAFRLIYSHNINFRHIEKYDIDALTRNLLAKVRAKLQSDIVKEILVEQFNFIEKATLHK